MFRIGDVVTVSSYSEGIMNSGSTELIRELPRVVLRPVFIDGGSPETLWSEAAADLELIPFFGDALVR